MGVLWKDWRTVCRCEGVGEVGCVVVMSACLSIHRYEGRPLVRGGGSMTQCTFRVSGVGDNNNT